MSVFLNIGTYTILMNTSHCLLKFHNAVLPQFFMLHKRFIDSEFPIASHDILRGYLGKQSLSISSNYRIPIYR